MAAARQRRTSGSSRNSPYDRMSPLPHHRFDHMIGEQKNLVTNAQEGLNQTLQILEKATTKEEMDSAKLQVASLLPRCDELLTKLMVIVHVRSELDCLQKDLHRAKKERINATKLYTRQQWLETRLEKLVFSKRRARPGAGARLQRGAMTQAHFQSVCGPLGRRVQPQHERQPVHPPPTSQHKRSATISTTISDTLGGHSYSLAEDEEDSSMTSYLESGGRRTTTAGTQSYPEVESSEWNSESEANWTVVDACSNMSGGGKRRFRSKQTMVDKEYEEREEEEGGEEREEGVEEGVEEGGKRLPRQQPNDALYTYNQGQDRHISSTDNSTPNGSSCLFESTRPDTLFGTTSWNVLLLAKYGNCLDKCQVKVHGPPDSVVNNPLIDNSLVTLWRELLKLQELVQSASRIMRRRGQTLPPIPSNGRTHLFTPGSRVGVARGEGRRGHVKALSENDKLKWEDLVPVAAVNTAGAHGTSLYTMTYPKSSFSWYHNEKQTGETNERERGSGLSETMSFSLKHSRRLASRSKSAKKKSLTALVNEHLEDYKQRNVEDSIVILKHATSEERRIDAALALRYIAMDNDSIKTDIISTLQRAVINDASSTVKHEALKSLIQHGAWDSQLYHLVAEILDKGNEELIHGLLDIITNECTILMSSSAVTSEEEVGRERLLSVMGDLVSNGGHSDIALKCALILTKAGCCTAQVEATLRDGMIDGSHGERIEALLCLVNYYDFTDDQVISNSMRIMETASHWKIRLQSVECLVRAFELKLSQLQQKKKKGDDGYRASKREVVRFAKRRLITEPVHTVRVALGGLLTLLGEKNRLEVEFIRKLEATDEMHRAEAVVALSSVASGNSKVQNVLMDTVEYDPSVFVRLLVLSCLGKCSRTGLTPITLSRIHRKCVGTSVLARQCRTVMTSVLK